MIRIADMPVIADWIDKDETIALIDYRGAWLWDEAIAANLRVAEMIAAKPYRCDMIGNFRSGAMESIRPALDHARKILALMPNNLTMIVVVTNPVISMLASVYKSLDPKWGAKIYTATTFEHARGMIVEDRDTRHSAS
jgi:hypothetical protein